MEAGGRHELCDVVHQAELLVIQVCGVWQGLAYPRGQDLVLGTHTEHQEVVLQVAPQRHEPEEQRVGMQAYSRLFIHTVPGLAKTFIGRRSLQAD